MKRILTLSILFLLLMSFNPFKNLFAGAKGESNYEQLWKKLEEHRDDDLPKQVIKDAKSIYDKARSEENFGQLLKAWMVMTETESNIDPEKFDLSDIKPLPHEGAVKTAIYNAIMASAYLEMAQSYMHDYDDETRADYRQKSDSLFTASLADREALFAESAMNYTPIVEEGSDSRLYNHDLLSVLTRFALEHSRMNNAQKAQLADELAGFYLAKGNREAATLLRIEHINYLHDLEDYNLRLKGDAYIDAIKTLLQETEGLEVYTDVAELYCGVIYGEERIDFCREVLAMFPKAYNARFFTGTIDEYLRPEFRLNIPDNILSDRPFTVQLQYENITEAKFEVRRFNGYNDKYQREPKLNGELVWSRQYTLADDSVNVSQRSKGYPTKGVTRHELTLPAGQYVLVANAASKQETSVFRITSMRLMVFRMPHQKVLALVRHNETGRPMADAKIRILNRSGQTTREIACDRQGEVLFDYDESQMRQILAFIPGTDDQTLETSLGYTPDLRSEGTSTTVRLFTDRAIYRPGQVVHVSGISFSQHGDETWTNPSRQIELMLKDANYRKAATQNVVTNNLGSFDADFTLPADLMPGRFQITCDNASVSFRVEEYKRPTFEVEAKPTATEGRTYTFGDTIEVEADAKTYAGVPVQGAKAHYRIETARVEFWRWWDTSWILLDEGETVTDDAGIARIPVFLNPQALDDSGDSVVRYRITFDVTDVAGETHSASHTLAISRRSFALQIQASSTIDASTKPTVVIQAINANREPVAVTGTYYIYKKDEAAPANLDEQTPVMTADFTSGSQIALPVLPAGDYVMRAVAFDSDRTPIEALHSFDLFDSSRQLDAAHFTHDFNYTTHSIFSEEEDAELFFSPAEADAYVSYHIVSNDSIIERHNLTLDRQITRLRIPYDKKYGHGVEVHVYYVRNGHLLQSRHVLTYDRPDKQLKLAWSTFRDRLYPGQDEEWILTISDPQGNPVSGAELLATMYDASLDALAPHAWSFGVSFNRQVTHYAAGSTSGNYSLGLSIYGPYPNKSYLSRRFDELSAYEHERWHRSSRLRMRSRAVDGAMMPLMSAPQAYAMAENDIVDYCVSEVAYSAKTKASVTDEEEFDDSYSSTQEEETASAAIRSNFAETAFFYPHLLSDDQGQVHISFTLPESLTEWRFMGLAHDRSVNSGKITANAVARKDFMVQPNLPRFVREGDHATIAARVINQCDDALNGYVRLRLFDAETDQLVHSQQLPVSVEAGKTESVTFTYEADDQHPMLICEIVGFAGNTSDGERNYLPVLSSRKYITEAVPFYVLAEDSVKNVDLSTLFNNGSTTATQRRLILEYTHNPSWTIIEALDGIKLPDFENAPDYAASLYANTMAAQLAQSIPGFEEALRLAQRQTTASQLELNDDLRDILLKESPWVIEALHESEQRARLIDLFDSTKMAQRTSTALQHLQRMQKSDGSWSWFEGMQGNYYITLSTCENLIGLCQYNADVDRMVDQALQYLDKREYEAYKQSKKDKHPIYVGNSTIDYLYICAMKPDREVGRDIQKMRREMLDVLGRSIRDLTIYGRTRSACILRAFGRTKEADKFLESAVEYTVTKPGMGRYYATDIAYYSWRDYRIPTQLAAMNALQQSPRADKQELLREMQIWLLRQKQTQTWDNPMNTISAVQFLLAQDADQVGAGAGQMPGFTLDAQALPAAIDTTHFLAEQLGYIRTEVSRDLIDHGTTSLTITPQRHDSVAAPLISWGAVYAQYMEQLDRLSNQSSGELSVEVRYLDADGKAIDPATTPLHVGDRVTMRIVVKADRDMDFVQVRCQRPACFEPVEQCSGFSWMGGRGGYVAQHDASTDVFFDCFTRGTTTFDLQFRVDRLGSYLTGIATAQCAYATEFCAHSKAIRVVVSDF